MEEKKCCFRCEGLLFVKQFSGGKRGLRRNGAVSFFCLLFLIPPQPLTHPPPSSLPSPPSSSHSVNSVSAQTDKTVRFTRPHVRGSTRKSPLKTTHAPPPLLCALTHPPTHTDARTHIYILTSRYLWPGPHPPLTLQATIFTITPPSIIITVRADCFHMGRSNTQRIHIYTYQSIYLHTRGRIVIHAQSPVLSARQITGCGRGFGKRPPGARSARRKSAMGGSMLRWELQIGCGSPSLSLYFCFNKQR